ncbi:MAG TPA: hypothetical protein VGS97_26145 [Actinocrinis sp.]|uniref:hypothetical protein n=1 Tax=Actinocrinis sp. TaxID=1920516 RepID=UPI002DDCC836|nr:hypothetical protein [Actinocrinis sp.]HEV2347600.1 hypothetical protein [Actinocrinis sp.]
MASREADALRTESMHKVLSVFLPPTSSYRWADGVPVVSGVFLESPDTICLDSYWRGWGADGRERHIRRRVSIQIMVEETDVEP